jgi:nucleoside-diphosphate-sugar epimerase
VERPARRAPLEHDIAYPVGTGRRRVLITGAGGQLGRALQAELANDDVVALTRADWDVTQPPPLVEPPPTLVLHAAAWTDVDRAEEDPQGAAAVNVGGTRHAAELGAPLVYYSSDYVFDGRKTKPYVESDAPNPQSAYGRTKSYGEGAAGGRAWIVRSSWLFGAMGHNFVRTMLRLGRERDEVAVVDDQRACPKYVVRSHDTRGARAAVRRLPRGRRRGLHVGRVRRGDLRGGRSRLSRAADHELGAEPSCAAPGLLRAAKRKGRAGAPTLARGATRVPCSYVS